MRILFAGTPNIAAIVLKELAKQHEIAMVITRQDSAVGRKRIITPSDVAIAAQELSIPVLKSNKIGSDELQRIQSANVDVAVVVAYGSLIPAIALNLFPWWNLHFSVLPAWRGATPLQHSLIHKSGQGISLFQLESTLDTGPILESLEVDLPEDKSAGEIMVDLALTGTKMILRNLAEPREPRPQTGNPTFATKISRANARLDFKETSLLLQRKIHAFNPEPVAWCKAGEGDLRVLRAAAIGSVDWNSLADKKLSPGEIEISNGKVLVSCGSGSLLELLEVQPAGGKPMLAADWYRGYSGNNLE